MCLNSSTRICLTNNSATIVNSSPTVARVRYPRTPWPKPQPSTACYTQPSLSAHPIFPRLCSAAKEKNGKKKKGQKEIASFDFVSPRTQPRILRQSVFSFSLALCIQQLHRSRHAWRLLYRSGRMGLEVGWGASVWGSASRLLEIGCGWG